MNDKLSGWKYLNEKNQVLPNQYNDDRIIYKTYVQPTELFLKGSGSAYGGKWIPKKDDDKRFLGEPGEIKVTYDKNGEMRWTKIGEGGKAIMERHFSDHNKPFAHSNPHDHEIRWNSLTGCPEPSGPINYLPDGVPEFKTYERLDIMNNNKDILYDDYKFNTISEFKNCIKHHGEVEFEWKGKAYSITHPAEQIHISEGCYEKDGKYYNVCSHTEYNIEDAKYYKTADELLEFMVGEDRLGDIVTQIYVVMRNI